MELLKCHSFKITIPEITQFAEGLESLGVLDYMKKYPDIMRELFVHYTSSLTAGTCLIIMHLHISLIVCIGILKDLFEVNYSPTGTKERDLEEATYIYFADFLDRCEGKFS